MAIDATGTPTSPDSIPKYNTAVDAPSGKGFNAVMDAIQTIFTQLKAGTLASGKIAAAGVTPGSNGQFFQTTGGASVWGAAPTGVSTGIIEMFGGATAPSGYVLCDGTSYLRSGGGVDALFAVIGTTYGFADGTHFNVPDLRGRVPVGFAASGGHTDVSTLNNGDGQAVANRRPKHRTTNGITILNASPLGHSHTPTEVNDIPNSGVANAASRTTGNSTETGGTGASIGGSVGTNVANDALDTPSYLVVNYVIKT